MLPIYIGIVFIDIGLEYCRKVIFTVTLEVMGVLVKFAALNISM